MNGEDYHPSDRLKHSSKRLDIVISILTQRPAKYRGALEHVSELHLLAQAIKKLQGPPRGLVDQAKLF